MVTAAKTNNQADFQKYNAQWYKNADDIATFLSRANPNWQKNELKTLLDIHLKMLTDNVVARLKKDWKGDVVTFDKGEAHIIKLADTLSDGIIKQFPQKFK